MAEVKETTKSSVGIFEELLSQVTKKHHPYIYNDVG